MCALIAVIVSDPFPVTGCQFHDPLFAFLCFIAIELVQNVLIADTFSRFENSVVIPNKLLIVFRASYHVN